MRTFARHKLPAILLAIVLAAPLLASACAKAATGPDDDLTITTRVKTAFINDPIVGLLRIDVSTFKGVVTLSGRVKSKEEEQKAIEIARTIRGVTDVKSTIQIQPSESRIPNH
jgi:osmotically-inducible protein OsmY